MCRFPDQVPEYMAVSQAGVPRRAPRGAAQHIVKGGCVYPLPPRQMPLTAHPHSRRRLAGIGAIRPEQRRAALAQTQAHTVEGPAVSPRCPGCPPRRRRQARVPPIRLTGVRRKRVYVAS